MNVGAISLESDQPPSLAKTQIMLGMLNAVEENSIVTQRTLARELGIALGLVNAYLKRCVTKGYIKVTHAPAKRYAYYLTPRGFAAKGRLTAQYLSYSFDFFRVARAQCSSLFAHCEAQGWQRVVLCGPGELAEIATLCASGHAVTLLGTADFSATDTSATSAERLAELGEFDAVVITDHRHPQMAYDRLVAELPRERVLVPRLLNISRVAPRLME
jgi:DNA-binding MarR family transcriptional regulator